MVNKKIISDGRNASSTLFGKPNTFIEWIKFIFMSEEDRIKARIRHLSDEQLIAMMPKVSDFQLKAMVLGATEDQILTMMLNGTHEQISKISAWQGLRPDASKVVTVNSATCLQKGVDLGPFLKKYPEKYTYDKNTGKFTVEGRITSEELSALARAFPSRKDKAQLILLIESRY